MHSDAARAFTRFVCGQHGSMQVVHNVCIHERRWPDADGAQAHCDCGWDGPRRSQANASLVAQVDAWDHIERIQRAVNADRLVPA